MHRSQRQHVEADLHLALSSDSRWRWFFSGLFLVLLLLYGLRETSLRLQESLDTRLMPDTGRMLEIGPESMYLECAGDGEPLVLFDAPIGAGSAYWRQQKDIVSKYTQACVFDRFGYGRSSARLNEANADQLAADIDRLLRHSRLSRPFVFVSAETGVFTAQSLAKYFPDRLQGIIISDPISRDSTASWWPLLQTEDELARSSFSFGRMADFALLQVASQDFLARFIGLIRPSDDAEYVSEILLPDYWRNISLELSALSSSRSRVSDELLGFLPLSLLWSEPNTECGRSYSEENIQARRERAEQLASLSSNGSAIAVPGVCRDMVTERPEAITPEILRAVEKYRDYLNNGH